MNNNFKATIIFLSTLLAGCGGGGDGSNETIKTPAQQDKQERVALSANDLSLSFSEYGIAYPQVSNFYGEQSYSIAEGAAEDVVWVEPNTGEMTLLAAGVTQITIEDSSSYYSDSSTTFSVTVEPAKNDELQVSNINLPTVESNELILPVRGYKGKLTYSFEPEGLVNFDEETGHIWSTGIPGDVEITVNDSGDRNYQSTSASTRISIEAVNPDSLLYSYVERPYQEGLTLSPLKFAGVDAGTYHFELDEEYKESDVLTVVASTGIMTVHKQGNVRIKVTQQLDAEYGNVKQEAFFEVRIMPGVRKGLTVSDSEIAYQKDFLYKPAVNNNIAPVRFEVVYGEGIVQIDEQTGLVRIIGVGDAEIKASDNRNENYEPEEKYFSINVVPAAHPGLKAQTSTYTYREGLSVTPSMEGQIGTLMLSGNTDVVSLSGHKFTILKAGTANLTVSDDGGVNYQVSPNTDLKISVLKAQHPGFSVEDINTKFSPNYCKPVTITGNIGAVSVTPVSSADNGIAEYDSEQKCFLIKRSGTARFNVIREESENYLESNAQPLNVIVNRADSRLNVDGGVYGTYSEEVTTINHPAIGGSTGHISFELVEGQSEPNVVTINPVSGEMTIHNAGSAVVKVTDAGNDKYKAASTNFSVTIDKANNPFTVFYENTTYAPDGEIVPRIENLKGAIRYTLYDANTSPVTLGANGILNIRSTGTFNVEVVAEETKNYKSREFTVGAFIEKVMHPGIDAGKATIEYEPLKKVMVDLPKAYGTRTYSTSLFGGSNHEFISVHPNSGEISVLDYGRNPLSAIFISETESEFYKALSPVYAKNIHITPPEKGKATRDFTLAQLFTTVESSVDYANRPYNNTSVRFAGATVLQPTDEELQKFGRGIALSVGMQSVDSISEFGRKLYAEVRIYVQRYEGCSTSVNIPNLPNLMKDKKASSFEDGNDCLNTRLTSRYLTYTVVDKTAFDKFHFYDGVWETEQPFVTYRVSDDYAASYPQSKSSPTELLEWDRIELNINND